MQSPYLGTSWTIYFASQIKELNSFNFWKRCIAFENQGPRATESNLFKIQWDVSDDHPMFLEIQTQWGRLHDAVSWQAVWKCRFYFPVGIRSEHPLTLPNVPKASSMTMMYPYFCEIL